MPYIFRDEDGRISRVTNQPIYGAEMVPYDLPELSDFLRNNGQNPRVITDALNELQKSDAAMARAVEDVINALMKKNLLKMNDLPQPVQERISERLKLRMAIEETLHQASENYGRTAFMNGD